MTCTLSGYGGLFGLHQGQDGINLYDPGTTAAQADAAAKLLASLLLQCGGNLGCALSHYSGGGYSSVALGGSPPDPAFTAAEQAYGLPAGVLTGIWHIEAGGAIPNPCVNDGSNSANVCCGEGGGQPTPGGSPTPNPQFPIPNPFAGLNLGGLLPLAAGGVLALVALPAVTDLFEEIF